MGFNHKLTFWRQKLLIYLRNLVVFFFASSLIMVVVYRFVPVYITPLMLIRCVEYAWKGEDVRVLKKWTPIEEMPDFILKAAVVSEDYYYLKHNGIDIGAIRRAYEYNRTHKKFIGGSTITQQTAKNVFLYPHRTYFRKAVEAYFALLIDYIWGKERVLEVYLNVAETGHGIYGMPMAAEIYYGKKLSELSKQEIATIVALLPAPLSFNPAKPSRKLIKQRDFIVREVRRIKTFDLDKRICIRAPKVKKAQNDKKASVKK